MSTATNSDNWTSADNASVCDSPETQHEALDEFFAEMSRCAEPILTPVPKPVVVQGTPVAPRSTRVAYRPRPRTHVPADDNNSDCVYYLKQSICVGLVLLCAVLCCRGVPVSRRAVMNPFADSASTMASDHARRENGLQAKPIRDVRVGERLVGRNPIREQAELVEPDPATWRKISLYMTKENDLGMWIDLLRHESWIAEYDIRVGNIVFIDLFELGIEGDVEVTYVGPCPPIQSGTGTVVTGTFKHQAEPGTKVVHLRLEDQLEPTGVTDNHPYWSMDRREFVAVGDLRNGELVDTEYGLKHVISVTPFKYADYLYNLETTEHVYRVGSLGTLVHNICGLARKFDGTIHHIASDKNKMFTPLFESLFDRAGLSMQSPWNRMRIGGHVGPHGQFYNKLVYDRLTTAVGTQTGNAARQALITELKAIRRDIRYGGWDALLKAPASWVDVRGKF